MRPEIVIAGSGVAGLEAMLALRALAADRVHVTLLSPSTDFSYRPLAIAAPFGVGQVQQFDVKSIAQGTGASFRLGALAGVDAARRVLRTTRDLELPYDMLVVATGARPREALPGALTFCGEEDVDAMQALLVDAVEHRVKDLVFALPEGVTWPLPLYELALLTAAHLGADAVELTFVTPEETPLAVFGRAASETIGALLEEHRIALRTARRPVAIRSGVLELAPEGGIVADRVVSLPRLKVPHLGGLPQDADGFLPTDAFGRVEGLDAVFAAGDVTAFPIKQGGIAAQQADVVAETIAATAGVPAEPKPFRPVLRGLLLTGAGPRFLAADIEGNRVQVSSASTNALWWHSSKIVGRYLTPFLASQTGLVIGGVPPADAAHPLHG
jgi:sulfide:quinone oxidoreductase